MFASQEIQQHLQARSLFMNGLLRVGGRLANAPLQPDANRPIILPKSHQVVRLIIGHFHSIPVYSGVEHVLCPIRERSWIIAARSAVRK